MKFHRLSFYCTGTQILQAKNGCRTKKTVKTNDSKINTMHDGRDCSVHPLDDYANRQHNFSLPRPFESGSNLFVCLHSASNAEAHNSCRVLDSSR